MSHIAAKIATRMEQWAFTPLSLRTALITWTTPFDAFIVLTMVALASPTLTCVSSPDTETVRLVPFNNVANVAPFVRSTRPGTTCFCRTATSTLSMPSSASSFGANTVKFPVPLSKASLSPVALRLATSLPRLVSLTMISTTVCCGISCSVPPWLSPSPPMFSSPSLVLPSSVVSGGGGRRTALMTWMTPLLAEMFAEVTVALVPRPPVTVTTPPATPNVRLRPSRVFN
mmetsp:Transcript_903/g.2161  ORF Transcript_903/g.2161 Transcript_903/m.2161 type:complete len:229 (-) Transcript_903:461-1147(-)